MIGVLLALILFGGVFITSNFFLESVDEPKSYFLLISSLILLLLCFITRKGVLKLIESLKSRSFFIGITIVCLLTTVHGLLQYFGLMPTFHRAFPITGAFDNPAGFAAVQAAMFPMVFIHCFDKECGRFLKTFSIVVSVLCATSVILAGSRTGFIAICAAFAVVLAYTDAVSSLFKAHRWLWLPTMLIAVTALILLYFIKQDSADGRVFIWSRCLEMIKERPLFGYGRYGFQGNYMIAQAKYFNLHPDSPFVMIADNVIHPFNEYIKLTVNYGLFGLSVAIIILVLIVRRLFKCDKQTKVLGLSFVASVFVMCQFSYPFQYSVIWLLLFMTITPAFINMSKKTVIPGYVRIMASASLLIGLAFSLRNMYYEMKWTEIAKRCRKGSISRMIPYYEDMKHVMKDNPLFLYNFGAELNYDQRYEESIDIITLFLESWNDYNVQILLSDSYAKNGQMDKALISLDEAYYMIPCRFEPLYRKMMIYGMSNDTINALRMANEILDKPVKVQSDRLQQMVSVAEEVINRFENN